MRDNKVREDTGKRGHVKNNWGKKVKDDAGCLEITKKRIQKETEGRVSEENIGERKE